MAQTDATPLSCCIIARNEADRIGDVIRAVTGLVTEIVVVDSGSTDATVQVAEALGARVVHHDWPGYGPQKRFSEDCARYDWILNLDADEIVTPELLTEIKTLMTAGPKLNAYRFRIRSVYPGQSKPRLWADFHNYVRLYDRRVVRFRDSKVHDTVDTRDEPVGQLTGSVMHFSARSFDHIRAKFESYNNLQATVLKKPAWTLWARLPLEYPLGFLRYYLFRRHFTGGLAGLRVSHIAAEARFRRILKFLAARRNGQGEALS